MNEWGPVNALAEGEPCPDESRPYYPDLQFGPGSAGMDIWFRTEDECWDFIRTEILTAIEEPAWKRGR